MMEAPTPPNEYPHQRDWAFSEIVDLTRYDKLQENWEHSREEMKRIQAGLQDQLPEEVRTVAVAGSLGRMEAAPNVSDCDAIVVLHDDVEEGSRKAVHDKVWDVLKNLGVEAPKATGNFADPTTAKDLCDKKHVGASDENMKVFSKRVLLLLETQPLYNEQEYDRLITEVVEGYGDRYVSKDSKKEWGFLINDLVRYFRSLCVNYQWDFENEPEKWCLRNVKLRHSRLIMYGGLRMLLGECSRERKDKVGWLRGRLRMTPLERTAFVYAQRTDTGFFRIAGFYNTFLRHLNDADVRDELMQFEPESESYDVRYKNTHYATLKANSDGLVAELVRFVLNQQSVWTERFFEYLLF